MELDGTAHDSDAAWRRDEVRSGYLASLDLRVMRIENRHVMENLDGALAYIRSYFGGE